MMTLMVVMKRRCCCWWRRYCWWRRRKRSNIKRYYTSSSPKIGHHHNHHFFIIIIIFIFLIININIVNIIAELIISTWDSNHQNKKRTSPPMFMILSTPLTTPKKQSSSFMAFLSYWITPTSTISKCEHSEWMHDPKQQEYGESETNNTSGENSFLSCIAAWKQFCIATWKRFWKILRFFESKFIVAPHSSIPSKDGEISATGIHTRGKIYNPQQLPHLLFFFFFKIYRLYLF